MGGFSKDEKFGNLKHEYQLLKKTFKNVLANGLWGWLKVKHVLLIKESDKYFETAQRSANRDISLG